MTRPLSTLLLALALLAPSLSAQRSRMPSASPNLLAELAAKCGTALDWKANDPRLLEEGSNQREVMESRRAANEFKSAAAFDAALAEAAASKRLLFWYAPRITAGSGGRQMYRPAVLDGYVMSVLFTDPDCVELLNRKFVCVRLTCDNELGKRFEITAPEITEPALFVCTPDGKLVRQVHSLRSFNAAWLDAFLQEVLSAHPELNAPSAARVAAASAQATGGDPGAVGREALADGDFAGVRTAIGELAAKDDPASLAASFVLAAKAARRQGRLAEALMQIDMAEKAAAATADGGGGRAGQAGRADLDCERGRALLLDRRLDDAAAAFSRVKSGARRAEAQYFLGVCDFMRQNEAMAAVRWKEAAALGADNPWAWKAATNIVDGADRTPLGAVVHGFEDVFLPQGDTIVTPTSAVPRDLATIERLSKGAIDYLIRLQRENGGWTDSRYAYWPTPDLTPNAWVAATVLSCTALLEWRDLDPVRIDEALRRGEAYAFDERKMNRGFNEEIYADGYKLVYLARKFDLARSDDERRLVVDRMNHVVRALERTQISGGEGRRGNAAGFWAHEYPNPFCTAAVMNGLHLAKERGATVPGTMMTGGADALLSVRSPDGSYAYGAGRPSGEEARITEKQKEERQKNSMARSPVCEAALVWAGHERGSPESVDGAMKNFWTFLPRFEKVRKCDFHTDGELAGFFWWHALFHTSEAVKTLPAAQRNEENGKLLEVLLRVGEKDGSFIDSHEMGKSYGTAMGLLTLKNVLRDGKP